MSDAVRRGELLLDLGRFEEAEVQISLAIADYPNDAEVLLLLARARHGRGDSAGAVDVARSALAADPTNPSAHGLLSVFLRALGRHSEALASAQQSVQLEPHHWWNHYNVAMAYLSKERHEPRRALESINAALQLDPFQADAHNLAGVALQLVHRDEEAVVAFQEALRLDPQNAHALSNLAESRADAGQMAAGFDLVRAGLHVDPTSDVVRKAYRNLLYRLMRRLYWVMLLCAVPLVVALVGDWPWLARAGIGTFLIVFVGTGLWRFQHNLPRQSHLHVKDMMTSAKGWMRWGVVMFWATVVLFLALSYAPRDAAIVMGLGFLVVLRIVGVVALIGIFIRGIASLFKRSPR